jgi:hypothetical protein
MADPSDSNPRKRCRNEITKEEIDATKAELSALVKQITDKSQEYVAQIIHHENTKNATALERLCTKDGGVGLEVQFLKNRSLKPNEHRPKYDQSWPFPQTRLPLGENTSLMDVRYDVTDDKAWEQLRPCPKGVGFGAHWFSPGHFVYVSKSAPYPTYHRLLMPDEDTVSSTTQICASKHLDGFQFQFGCSLFMAYIVELRATPPEIKCPRAFARIYHVYRPEELPTVHYAGTPTRADQWWRGSRELIMSNCRTFMSSCLLSLARS